MTAIARKTAVAHEGPPRPDAAASSWVAEFDGEVVGRVDRIAPGAYRATDRRGRRAGTFRTLTEARDALAVKNSTTALQRMNQSRLLLFGGLVAFLATAVVAAIGLVSLLST